MSTGRGAKVLGMVALWVAVVALATGVTWFAVNRAGQQVLGPVTGADVAAGQPDAPAPSPVTPIRPSTPAAPTPTATGGAAPPAVTAAPSSRPATAPRTSRRTNPPPAPPPAARAVSVVRSTAGGTIEATCRGAALSLDSAVPADGYSVKTERHGLGQVSVRFEADKSRVRQDVSCVNGRPTFSAHDDG